MLTNKALWGALAGALVAIVWVTFDSSAVLLVIALAAVGWLIGTIIDRPEVFIRLLQRLQDR